MNYPVKEGERCVIPEAQQGYFRTVAFSNANYAYLTCGRIT